MKPVVWFRVTAVLFLLFAAGHTFGFLTFRPPSEEGRNVWTAMNNVHFSVGSSTYSYGNFYLGFGLIITVFQLFEAWLSWVLGSMARRGIAEARTIAFGMIALQIFGLGLSLRYFSAGPALLSGLTAITLAIAAMLMRRTGVVSTD
jgi:hypothetical protein